MKTLVTVSLSLLMSTAFVLSGQAQTADQSKPIVAPVSPTVASQSTPYTGMWQGIVRTSSGNHRVSLDVASRPGDNFPIADVTTSAQSPFSVLVDSFETKDHHVRITMHTAGTAFEGNSNKNMTEIRGLWTQDGKSYVLTLRRFDPDNKTNPNGKRNSTAQSGGDSSSENGPAAAKVRRTPAFAIGPDPWFEWFTWAPPIGGQERPHGLNYW